MFVVCVSPLAVANSRNVELRFFLALRRLLRSHNNGPCPPDRPHPCPDVPPRGRPLLAATAWPRRLRRLVVDDVRTPRWAQWGEEVERGPSATPSTTHGIAARVLPSLVWPTACQIPFTKKEERKTLQEEHLKHRRPERSRTKPPLQEGDSPH